MFFLLGIVLDWAIFIIPEGRACGSLFFHFTPLYGHDHDMMSLYPKIQDADIIVYISPLYYHNISAQMKAVIDRYHGIDDLIRHKPKKVLAIITAAYPED